MTESIIMKIICGNHGALDFGELTDIGSGMMNLKGVFEMVMQNRELFCVATCNGRRMIIARTKVRLCTKRVCAHCDNLHLCKDFVFGRCSDGSCSRCTGQYCEALDSPHNARVLRENFLQELNRKELCTLLIQNDSTLLPPVCITYNKIPGKYGYCPNQESCKRLHICEKYIKGTCQAGLDCTKSHDFMDPHPLRVLQERGVPQEMIGRMLLTYQNIDCIVSNSLTDNSPEKGRHSEKISICVYYIKGSCRNAEKCPRVHCKMPYKWQMETEQGWSAMPDNEGIERAFCNPANVYSGGIQPVNFGIMTCGSARVRRLSTVSSVLHPNFIHTTQWLWYWEDDFGNWTLYTSSDHLEKKYHEDANGVLEVRTALQEFLLSFHDMMQRNKVSGREHLVRRRPVFVPAATIQSEARRQNELSWKKQQGENTSGAYSKPSKSLHPLSFDSRMRGFPGSVQIPPNTLAVFSQVPFDSSVRGVPRILPNPAYDLNRPLFTAFSHHQYAPRQHGPAPGPPRKQRHRSTSSLKRAKSTPVLFTVADTPPVSTPKTSSNAGNLQVPPGMPLLDLSYPHSGRLS